MKQLSCLLLLTILGCSSKLSTSPEAGKAYFVQAGCSACHRVGSEGSVGGPDLTLVGFRHSSLWLETWLRNPQAWKADTLMPNKQLSDAMRLAIVNYLATLKGQDWAKGQKPWDLPHSSALERGKKIYEIAGCVACHGINGKGGYPNNNVKGTKIPALANVFETYSRNELKDKIKRGVLAPAKEDTLGPPPLVFMPSWQDVLTDSEIDDVIEYLFSLQSHQSQKLDW